MLAHGSPQISLGGSTTNDYCNVQHAGSHGEVHGSDIP